MVSDHEQRRFTFDLLSENTGAIVSYVAAEDPEFPVNHAKSIVSVFDEARLFVIGQTYSMLPYDLVFNAREEPKF